MGARPWLPWLRHWLDWDAPSTWHLQAEMLTEERQRSSELLQLLEKKSLMCEDCQGEEMPDCTVWRFLKINHWVLLWHTSKVYHLSLITSLVNRLCNWQYFPKSPDTAAKPIPSTPIHKNSGLKVRLKTQDLAAQKQRLEANLLLKEQELATAKEKRLKGRGFFSCDNLNGKLSWRGVLLCFNASKHKACRTWMKSVQVHLGRHLYSAPQFWGHLCQIQCDRRGLFVDFTDPLYFMMLCYNFFALRLWEVFFWGGACFS